MNKEKDLVNEIFFLRAIACISIVLIHALTTTIYTYSLPRSTIDLFRSIQMTIMFATPMFVLISALVLSHAYKDHMPKGFLVKRFLYIVVPYLIMGTVYTAYDFYYTSKPLPFGDILYNKLVMGQWHGYFVLIIVQFYLLQLIFHKFVSGLPMKWVITGAFVINAAYLGFFNFVPPFHFKDAFYYWYDFSKIPFLAWIFYFTVAYYCGRNLASFRQFVRKYRLLIFAGCIASLIVVHLMQRTGTLPNIASTRVDLLAYTVLVMFSLFYLASFFKKVPRFVMIISNFSFGIYLLHPLFQKVIHLLYPKLPRINMGIFVLGLFVIGILGPMLVTFILNKLPLGKFVVGKIPALRRAPAGTRPAVRTADAMERESVQA